MKEKTLYYRVIVREVDRMVNDGFIIANICDGKLFSLEGVFAEDYLTAKIDEDAISLEYYSRYEVFGQYEKQWEIPIQNECFELPLYTETHLLSEEDYIDLICEGISMIPEDMVVHRLTGDAPRATLIGPMWSLKKWEVLNAIDKALVDRDIWQGKNFK